MTMTDITNTAYNNQKQENHSTQESVDETASHQTAGSGDWPNETHVNADDDASNDSSSTLGTLSTLLIINRGYREAIDEKLAQLNKLLLKNQCMQNEILMKSRNKNKFNNNQENQERALIQAKNTPELFKIKGNYFLDRFQSEPDSNFDTIRMRTFNYFNYTPRFKSEWTLEFRKKLRQSVLNDTTRILKTPFLNKISLLDEKLNNLTKSNQKSKKNEMYVQVRKLLSQARSQLRELEEMPEHEILKKADVDKVDWHKISKIDLNENWSETECRLVWINVCNPGINESKWSSNENSTLIELAREHKEKNWEIIANKLNTNRSAYFCMARYHQKTADKFCKRDWSERETQKLCEQAELYRIGFYIPYNYLCYLNGTRDRSGVYAQHLKLDPYLNHGKWQPEEKETFEQALGFFTSHNWQEISEFVGTRTAMQCKERFENKYLNPGKYRAWTREEDRHLLDACEVYENQWARITAEQFPTRTDHSLLFRFQKLMTWREQTAWLNSQPMQIQEFVMMLYARKRDESEENEAELRTSSGEVVPVQPKFGLSTQTWSTLGETVEEKTYQIVEFVEKKREGLFDAGLLTEIGLSSHQINRLFARHRKEQQQQARLEEKRLKRENIAKQTQPREKSAKIRERLKNKLEENNAGLAASSEVSADQAVAGTSASFEKIAKKKRVKKVKPRNENTNSGEADTSVVLGDYDFDLTDINLEDMQDSMEPRVSENFSNDAGAIMNIVDNMTIKIRKIRGKYKKRTPKNEITTADEATEANTQNKPDSPRKKNPKKMTIKQQRISMLPEFAQENVPVENNQPQLITVNLASDLKAADPGAVTFAKKSRKHMKISQYEQASTKCEKQTIKQLLTVIDKRSGIPEPIKPERNPSQMTISEHLSAQPSSSVTTLVAILSSSNGDASSAETSVSRTAVQLVQLDTTILPDQDPAVLEVHETGNGKKRKRKSETGAAKAAKVNTPKAPKTPRPSKRVNKAQPVIETSESGDTTHLSVNSTTPSSASSKSPLPRKRFRTSKHTPGSSLNEANASGANQSLVEPQIQHTERSGSKLIVDLSAIEEGVKIPCLTEQANEFRYTYSLKKEMSKLSYFEKFTVISCFGMYVGLKAMNKVTDEYLNDARMNAVEKALRKVMLIK